MMAASADDRYPMTARLDTELLVTQACETTGLDDFGEDTWQDGLERLADSLAAEAALNELGEQIVAGECVMYLANRLCVTEYRRRNPEIADVDVTPPIVIVGQGRTGTTILHDLLAQDPANACRSRGRSTGPARRPRPRPTRPIRASTRSTRSRRESSSSSPASSRCTRWARACRRSACASP